jgi:DNA-binding response OmpR family regulator
MIDRSPDSPEVQERRRRLLVVDDEPAFGKIVARAGTALGYDVEVTSRAVDFKRAYLRTEPDLICLDVVMPDVDGVQLMQWLTEQGCRSKVVIVTGFNPFYAELTERLAKARGRFATVTLSKPVSLSELQTALV